MWELENRKPVSKAGSRSRFGRTTRGVKVEGRHRWIGRKRGATLGGGQVRTGTRALQVAGHHLLTQDGFVIVVRWAVAGKRTRHLAIPLPSPAPDNRRLLEHNVCW